MHMQHGCSMLCQQSHCAAASSVTIKRHTGRVPHAAPPTAATVLPSSNVIERRAADVIVVGGSAAGLAAAYTLAKRGRKVLVLEDWGLDTANAAANLQQPPFQPLRQMEQDQLLVNLASEAAAYWRGLEMLAAAPLLYPCPSLDLAFAADADHPAAVALAAIRDTSRAAGLTVAELRADEVAARCSRALALPPDALALLHEDGGVIRAADARSALRVLGERVGVVFKDRLRLRGWRDAGDHFTLRASTELMRDAESLFEAEQLLLAPDTWVPTCLGLFGVSVPGVEVRRAALGRWSCDSELAKLPLWHCLGGSNLLPSSSRSRGGEESGSKHTNAGEAPQAALPSFGLPLFGDGARLRMGRPPALGVPVEGPFDQSIRLATAAELQALHREATSFIRGIGNVRETAPGAQLAAVVSDGRPALGWHPRFEDGRVMVCCALAGSNPHGPGFSSYQYSPVLAKLAADALLQASANAEVMELLALGREAVGADGAQLQGLDSWEGLQQLQRPPSESSEVAEERAEAAEELRKQALSDDLLGSERNHVVRK